MAFLAEDLARSGMTIGQVSVDTLDSWTQTQRPPQISQNPPQPQVFLHY